MYRISDSTLFIDDRKKIYDYLISRGVKDSTYLDFIKNNKLGILEPNFCSVDGFDFGISHFFGISKVSGYDIITANKNLGTDEGNIVSIGLIEGDDVICLCTKNNEIFLRMINNGNGETIKVANSFEALLKLITMEWYFEN